MEVSQVPATAIATTTPANIDTTDEARLAQVNAVNSQQYKAFAFQSSSSNSTVDMNTIISTQEHRTKKQIEGSVHKHQLQCDKDRVSANILRQGKVLKISRRLRTRLEYAILKIRRGWSKYTLQEVESLLQPGRTSVSPPIQSRRLAKLDSLSAASPRQSERKRTRKMYPDYETGATSLRARTRTPESSANTTLSFDIEPTEEDSFKRYRISRPSLSQLKDSELFSPAKSLMDIATSSPSPSSPSPSPPSRQRQHHQRSYSSNYHHPYQSQRQHGPQTNFEFRPNEPLYHDSTSLGNNWSSYSAPPSPATESSAMMAVQGTFMHDEFQPGYDDDTEGPPDTQAAKTILLLASSPTRPPPRILNISPVSHPNYEPATTLNIASSNIMSYYPMTSSPLVQSQVAYSTTSSSSTTTKRDISKNSDNTPDYCQQAIQGDVSSFSRSLSVDSTHVDMQQINSPKKPHRPETTVRDTTPALEEGTELIPPIPQTPPQQKRHAIRTPPPSGGKDPIPEHFVPHSISPKFTMIESIAARRRSSGLSGGAGADLVTMILKPEESNQGYEPKTARTSASAKRG